ncbi:MAG: hypothetical protein EP299_06270 [Acidobacteria bacterium]|nr:MAG: hypothetical protein EP299_06270 [Acidobacteriota bacterium]
MRPILWILLLTTVVALPGAVGAEVLELDQVVEMALERNPALQAVEERRDEVQAGVREAWADAYPQLALRSSWNRSRNPSLLNSADFEDLIELFPDFSPAVQELYNRSRCLPRARSVPGSSWPSWSWERPRRRSGPPGWTPD